MKKSRTSSSSGTTTAEPEVEEVNVRRSKRIASKSSNISQRESSQGSLPAVTWAPTGDISGAEDKPSIAIRSGLHHSSSFSPDALIQRVTRSSDLSGLWGLLPEELVEIILKQCSPSQLGMLEATCSYFHGNNLIEKIAKQRLRTVPRAKGLKPARKDGESYTMLLHYVNCQSAAAAQATAVACGAYHTSALLIRKDSSSSDPGNVTRHNLFMFGRGFHGQLGNDSFVSQKSPSVATLGYKPCTDQPDREEETMPAVVACGAHHSAAISRKGELFTWGLGCNGELGLGRWGPIELATPRQCSGSHVRIVSVSCGANHTLAIAESGTLWSCGRNRHGQLGTNTMVDGSRLQMVMNLGGYRVVSAAAGSSHSMALASDGSLFTWGDGSQGQLGHSELQHLAQMLPENNPIASPIPRKINRLDPQGLTAEHRVTAIAAGSNHSMALTVGGSILAFGSNEYGQLGTGDHENRWKPTRVQLALPGEGGACLRVVQLACGAHHSVALFSNQGSMEVRTAGSNSHGQLGHGDRMDREVFTPTVRISNVVAVQAGDEHSVAITASGDLYLWGRGDSGQLGIGDNRAKWKPTLLKEFAVVHPDKTLRRNKRNQPVTRPVASKEAANPCVHFM